MHVHCVRRRRQSLKRRLYVGGRGPVRYRLEGELRSRVERGAGSLVNVGGLWARAGAGHPDVDVHVAAGLRERRRSADTRVVLRRQLQCIGLALRESNRGSQKSDCQARPDSNCPVSLPSHSLPPEYEAAV